MLPHYYNQTYAAKSYLLNYFMWFLAISISLGIHLTGLLPTSQYVVVCTKILLYNDWGLAQSDNSFIIIVVVTTTVNIATLIKAQLTKKNNSLAPNITSALMQRRQKRLLKTMAFVVSSDVILWALSNQIINRTLTSLSPAAARMFGPYTAITFVIQPVLNLIFYAWIDMDFRSALLKLTPLKLFSST